MISIEIRGDYTQFANDMAKAKTVAHRLGADISNAVGNSLTPRAAANQITKLASDMKLAAQAAQSMRLDGERVTQQVEAIGRAAGLTGARLNSFAKAAQQSMKATEAAGFEKTLRNIQRTTGASAFEMARLRASVGDTAGALRQMGSAAKDSLANIANIRNAVAVGMAGYALKSAGGAAMQFDTYQRSFNAIAGSQGGGAAEMRFVREEADRLGQGLYALMDSYRGLSAAARTSGLSQAEVHDVFSSVGEAATTLGLSSENTKYALYALQQMMSKGVVSMEELRRQLGDSLPGAFAAAARAMNVTEGELIKLVESGQLMSRDFLPKFAAELRNTFGAGFENAAQSARSNFNRLTNAFTEMKGQIGSGFLDEVSQSALKFSQNIANNRDAIESFGKGLGFLAKNASVLAAAIGGRFLLAPLLGQLGQGFFSIASGANKAAAGLSVQARAMTGLKFAATGLLGVFGGPLGLAITGLAAGYVSLSSAESEAAKFAREHADALKMASGNAAEAKKAIDAYRQSLEQMPERDKTLEIEQLKQKIMAAGGIAHDSVSAQISGLASWSDQSEEAKQIRGIAAAFHDVSLSSTSDLKELRNRLQEVGLEVTNVKDLTNALASADALITLKMQADDLVGSISYVRQGVEGLIGDLSVLASAGNAIGQAGSQIYAVYDQEHQKVQRMLELSGGATIKKTREQKEELKQLMAEADDLLLSGFMSNQENVDIRAGIQALEDREHKKQSRGGAGQRRGGGGRSAASEAKKEARDIEQARKKEAEQIRLILDLQRQYQEVMGHDTEARRISIEMQGNAWRDMAGQIENANEKAVINAQITEMLNQQYAELNQGGLAGAIQGLKDYADAATDAYAQSRDAMQSMGQSIEDALVSMLDFTGQTKFNFSDMVQSMLNDMGRLMIRKTLLGPLADSLSGFLGGFFGGGGGGVSDLPPIKSAKGGIFSGPGISAFSGQVVSAPTFFPFAKGTGLMGEAGPEAILPLTRDGRGRLGVTTVDGQGQPQAPTVIVNVVNNAASDASVDIKQAPSANGLSLDVIVERKVIETVGKGKTDAYFKTAFGLNRRRAGR